MNRTKSRLWLGGLFVLALAALLAAPAWAAGDWPIYGGNYWNDRFSPLEQINTDNAGRLHVAFTFPLGTLGDHQSTPLAVGDTLYVTSSAGPKYVWAVDARSGAVRWVHENQVPADIGAYNCCGLNNRGAAYSNGRVFVGRQDAYLVALDARSGRELWKAQVGDYKAGTEITSPPLVVHDKVITGINGGEFGGRGSLQAYDVATGRLVWRTYTVPGPGERGNDTWKGDSWKHGGAVIWNVGAYDPKLNLAYWGTSNPQPWADAPRAPDSPNYGKYRNLWSSSVIAVNPDTGKIVWAFQEVPDDAWDYDALEPQLADLKIGGHEVPALLDLGKGGFLYVLDRRNGKLISAKPYVYVNWAKGVNQETGRPIEVPDKRPTLTHVAKNVCPHLSGGTTWMPKSWNPMTGLLYIQSDNMCQDVKENKIEYHRGTLYLGTDNSALPGPGNFLGEVIAVDPVTHKKVWGAKESLPYNGGVLSTAGGVVFYGDWEGWFYARDARTGRLLWKFNTGNGITAGPVSYAVDGKQYVAVVGGRLVAIPGFLGDIGKTMVERSPQVGGSLYVFSLD